MNDEEKRREEMLDRRAAEARELLLALATGRTTREHAEGLLREIEDAVRRECRRACEDVRDGDDAKRQYLAIEDPPRTIVNPHTWRPSERMSVERGPVYRQAAAGAHLCVLALRSKR